MTEEFKVFTKWTEFLEWLLDMTGKFPKKIRFTLTTRIDNIALDILDDIIEYRYDPIARESGFKKINIKFEKLRIFIRICHRFHYFSHRQYEYAMIRLNEVGKITGGWLKRDDTE